MVTLRQVQQSDSSQLLKWRNLPHVAESMYSDHQITESEHAIWFPKALADSSRKMWIIQFEGQDVGLLTLYDIDKRNSRCTLGVYIAALEHQGKGLGSAVEYLMLEKAFNELKVQKLCAEVFAFNEKAYHIHKKFGFHHDGTLRGHYFKSGRFEDVHLLSIFKPEWDKTKQKYFQDLVQRGLIAKDQI